MKIDEEKLYEAYYQPDQLWISGKATKGLHKTMSTPRKDIMVSKTSTLAGSYTISKGNTSSSLQCDKS